MPTPTNEVAALGELTGTVGAVQVGGAGKGGGVGSGAAPAQNIQIFTFQTITCRLSHAASARELPYVGVTGVHTQKRVCVTQQK